MSSIIDELTWRGLVHQTTSELSNHLDTPKVVFCGFDPTKDSLTIGNLVSICLLKRFEQFGHKPIVIMGGGTGLVGDPSGKDAERQMLSSEQIEANIVGQRKIFENILGNVTIINNIDWIGQLSFVSVLRDVGKHFSINKMIAQDSVKNRLDNREQGISFTEFSYMILQAFDFLKLFENHNVTLQVGGSDQWGNIVAGTSLVRKIHQKEVFGLTTPLITKADGGKFGKTESGAVWLSKERTSPFEFFQFWFNASDADIETFFKFFSFRTREGIEAIITEHKKEPQARRAQAILAHELTLLVHGSDGVNEAVAASSILFHGSVKDKTFEELSAAFKGTSSSEHSLNDLEGKNVIDLVVESGIVQSKREAREHLKNKALFINGDLIHTDVKLNKDMLLHDSLILIRKGKKTWHITKWK